MCPEKSACPKRQTTERSAVSGSRKDQTHHLTCLGAPVLKSGWATMTLEVQLTRSDPSSVSMLKGEPEKNMLASRWLKAESIVFVPLRTVVR